MSCNIVPAVLRCSVTFLATAARAVVPAIHNYIARVFADAIGGAKRLLDKVAIAADTPPPSGW